MTNLQHKKSRWSTYLLLSPPSPPSLRSRLANRLALSPQPLTTSVPTPAPTCARIFRPSKPVTLSLQLYRVQATRALLSAPPTSPAGSWMRLEAAMITTGLVVVVVKCSKTGIRRKGMVKAWLRISWRLTHTIWGSIKKYYYYIWLVIKEWTFGLCPISVRR